MARRTAAWKPSAPNSLSPCVSAPAVWKGIATGARSRRRSSCEPRRRLRVSVRHRRVGEHDQVDLAGEVVDDGELLGQQQQHVGHVGEPGGRGRRGVRELRLDVADGVVAEEPGEAAAETRQARARRDAVAAHEVADERQRVALVPLDDDAAILDFDRGAAGAQAQLRRQADERVAAEALAADDRLEQERVLPCRRA
ncbi:MAG: hypothetical protein V9E95_08760 [Methanothrix soehngenii]